MCHSTPEGSKTKPTFSFHGCMAGGRGGLTANSANESIGVDSPPPSVGVANEQLNLDLILLCFARMRILENEAEAFLFGKAMGCAS